MPIIDSHAHIFPPDFGPAPAGCDPAGWPSTEPNPDVDGGKFLINGPMRFPAKAVWFDAERRLEHAIRCSVEMRLASLTPRERQVMSLVVRGRLNKQIAADLGTGEKTIKVHRARVMAKMRARSVAQLVRLGSRAGIAVEPLGMAQIRPLFAMAPTASELSSLLSI